MNIIQILPIEILKAINDYDSKFVYCNKFTLQLITKKIYSYNLTNEQLDIITKLYPNITNLTLFNCKLITKIGIKYINRLSNLKILDLSHSNITDWRLKELKNLNNLQILNLTFCFRLSQDAMIDSLLYFPNLEQLNISKCHGIINYKYVNELNLYNKCKKISTKLKYIIISKYDLRNSSDCLPEFIKIHNINYKYYLYGMNYTNNIYKIEEENQIKYNLKSHMKFYNFINITENYYIL